MAYILSSSDSEDEIPIQPRSKRIRICDVLRQTSAQNIQPTDKDSKPSLGNDVYSSCVSKVFSKLNTVKMNTIMKNMENDPEDKDDCEVALFGRKPNGKQTKRGNRDNLRSSICDESAVDAPAVDCVDLNDTDIELDSSQGSLLSMSPPPSLPATPVPSRRKRTKGVKNAMALLNQASQLIHTSVVVDDDVLCVSPSPKKTPLVHKISVKLRSRSGIQRFPMAPTDSFSCIMKSMARREGVADDFIHIYLNDHLVEPFHTPASLGIGVTDILECYVTKPQAAEEDTQYEQLLDDPNSITVKVQGNNPRSRRLVTIDKREPMGKLMKEYSSLLAVPYGQLQYKFDGEDIAPTDTADDLDLESEFCIDVVGL